MCEGMKNSIQVAPGPYPRKAVVRKGIVMGHGRQKHLDSKEQILQQNGKKRLDADSFQKDNMGKMPT